MITPTRRPVLTVASAIFAVPPVLWFVAIVYGTATLEEYDGIMTMFMFAFWCMVQFVAAVPALFLTPFASPSPEFPAWRNTQRAFLCTGLLPILAAPASIVLIMFIRAFLAASS